MGQGIEKYDLVKDLQHQRANITYGQMLALSPKLRRQWTRSVNTSIGSKEKDNKDTMVVHASQDRDLVPVLDAVVEKKTVVLAYIDGGAQVCVMTENTMEKLGIRISHPSSVNMRLANHRKVRCAGIIKNVHVMILGIACLVVILAGDQAYPIILGRPWLMAIHAQQDWESGLLTIRDATHGRRIVYNMRTRELESRMVPKAEESSYSEETSEEESSTESEYGSLSDKEEGMVHMFPNMFDDEETTSSLNMVQVDVEKMLGSDLVETEKEDFVKMCDRYLDLFGTDYH